MSHTRSEVEAREDSQAIEKLLQEIDDLSQAQPAGPDLARRILGLRHQAGLKLTQRRGTEPGERPEYPAPAFDQLRNGSELPEVPRDELTPELLRAAILRNGSLLVRGLIQEDDVSRLVDAIDRAWEAREAHASGGSTQGAYYEEFEPDPRFDLALHRGTINRSGSGLMAADSPPATLEVLDSFERAGLGRLAAGYLGERPVISVNKYLLRKVSPELLDEAFEQAFGGTRGSNPSRWHQDGAFLGDVRALNVWLSLSRCGDMAPGLDIVPRRLDHIVPTGTEGALFDWSVSQQLAEDAAGELGIRRPIFEPGDALLFDELLLHSTAVEPGMTSMRYAVETWFFGPSGFPPDYAPLSF